MAAKKKTAPARKPPPTSKAPAYHHGDLRHALLQAAEAMLEETGVDSFTLRECARRAGVSHAAPAHHFGDVQGLLTALAGQAFGRMDTHMQERRKAAAADAFSQLQAVGMAYVEFALENRALFQLMFRSDRLRREDEVLGQAAQNTFQHLQDAMAQVQAAGSSPADRAPQVLFAWSLVHGFSTLFLEGQLEGFGLPANKPAAATAWAQQLLELSRQVHAAAPAGPKRQERPKVPRR